MLSCFSPFYSGFCRIFTIIASNLSKSKKKELLTEQFFSYQGDLTC